MTPPIDVPKLTAHSDGDGPQPQARVDTGAQSQSHSSNAKEGNKKKDHPQPHLNISDDEAFAPEEEEALDELVDHFEEFGTGGSMCTATPHYSLTEDRMLKDQDAKVRAFNVIASSPKASRSSSIGSQNQNQNQMHPQQLFPHKSATVAEFLIPPPPPSAGLSTSFANSSSVSNPIAIPNNNTNNASTLNSPIDFPHISTSAAIYV
ncbi:unnamed protein product [Ambrosiozyma monospora]|uniref:Unnamed protein product n=1 Tax=Ambrosiozyma monospora TaxID=43982 RepID=A0ACB5T9L7_AMBMO|nr:unnamed protein product [Ambrosiozyma monospora]